MKCPSCRTPLAEPVQHCPKCRFTLHRADPKFGAVPRHSRFLTDRSQTLSRTQIARLRDALRLFHKKFPQVLLSVFVTELPDGSSANEFAFWMANRARFGTVPKVLEENLDLLLVIDLHNNKAALVGGYGLEPFVSEDDLQAALDALAGPLRDGDTTAGILACIDNLTNRLRELSTEAQLKHKSAPQVQDW
jgi:uncharacterized membrane protein YgcG